MSEHDDEIRAKRQWLVDNKHITSPVETGMLICEVFDAFKEIATLKAQLKEAKKHREWLSDRLIHKYGENENCDYHIKARETVKARGCEFP